MGIPRGEYTAKPNLPGLGLRRLLFLKLTPMVHRQPKSVTNLKGAVFPPLPKDRGFYTEDFDEKWWESD